MYRAVAVAVAVLAFCKLVGPESVSDTGRFGDAETEMRSVALTVAPLSVKLAVMVTCESTATLPAVMMPVALTVAIAGLLLLQVGVTDRSTPSV